MCGFGPVRPALTNEFVLAKLLAKKNERELVVGEANLFGGSSGTQPKDTVELKIERVAPGVYKSLPKGQYNRENTASIMPAAPAENCSILELIPRSEALGQDIRPPPSIAASNFSHAPLW